MKRILKVMTITVIALTVLLGTPAVIPQQACDLGVAVEAEAASVKLSKTKTTMYVGTSTTLKVKGTSKKVTWSSTNKKVAAVTSKGKVTAKKAGTATIKAKVSGKIYKCKVTVKAVPKLNYKTKTVYVGKKTQLKLNGYKIGSVKWTTSNKKVATVSSKGLVTAKKAGTATIKATVGGKTLTFKAVVKNYPKLSKTKLTTYAGSKKQLSLTGTKIGTVTWKSSNKNVATVSSKGMVTTKKPGTATISATVGGKKLSCKVTVTSSLKSEYSTVELYEYGIFDFMWITYYGNGTIYCKSSDEDIVVAEFDEEFIGDDIFLNFYPGEAGTAYVTVTNSVTSEKVKIKVIVRPYDYDDGYDDDDYDEPAAPDVSSVSLSNTALSMNIGETKKLTATIKPSNANDQTVDWTSSNTKVATVDSKGNVKAISAGTAKITAKAGSKSAVCTVTIKTPAYKMGEIWEVEGNWRFKVNSVTEHYKCNSYSDKTGAQVVVVDYTFWCDGPTYTSDGKLNFNSMDFRVYDENGEAGSTYPCTHDKLTTSITAGKMCNGTQAFILPSNSDTMTLEVEEYDSDFVEQRATFELDFGKAVTPEPDEPEADEPEAEEPATGKEYKENKALLKSDLKQYGTMSTTSSGGVLYTFAENLTAAGTTVKATVTYSLAYDYLEFKMQYPVNDPSIFVSMVMDGEKIYGSELPVGNVKFEVSGMGAHNTFLPYMGTLTINPANYKAGNTYTFKEGAANMVTNSELQAFCNSDMELAVSAWQYMLSLNVYSKLFTLGNLGFELL